MNEKLALSDDILMKIEKPARYIGNEVNAVVKDLNNIDVRFCMCFPDVYEIGMSHLGIQILYGMRNSPFKCTVSEINIPMIMGTKNPIKNDQNVYLKVLKKAALKSTS